MRVFMTGASGWIGSATTAELLAAGHEVVGLARSADAAAKIEALGAIAVSGSIDSPEDVAKAADDSDGVIHLAYNHDFSDMAGAASTDGAVIAAIGDALAGSNRPLLIASGVLGINPGSLAVETDQPGAVHPRAANAIAAQALAERGVRSIVVRYAPTVHGQGDHGFISTLATVARERGVAAYVGDGSNRWPAIHRSDAARLTTLAFESAPAGAVVHAIAEEGVSGREIAEAIGGSLDLPVQSVPIESAYEHFGWIGPLFAFDTPASNAITRQTFSWTPTGPTLVHDIKAGHYFV